MVDDKLAAAVAKRKAERLAAKKAASKASKAAADIRYKAKKKKEVRAEGSQERKKARVKKRAVKANLESHTAKHLIVKKYPRDGFFYVTLPGPTGKWGIPRELMGKFTSLSIIERIAGKYGATIEYQDIQELSKRD